MGGDKRREWGKRNRFYSFVISQHAALILRLLASWSLAFRDICAIQVENIVK